MIILQALVNDNSRHHGQLIGTAAYSPGGDGRLDCISPRGDALPQDVSEQYLDFFKVLDNYVDRDYNYDNMPLAVRVFFGSYLQAKGIVRSEQTYQDTLYYIRFEAVQMDLKDLGNVKCKVLRRMDVTAKIAGSYKINRSQFRAESVPA